jgi:hypothetical protein
VDSVESGSDGGASGLASWLGALLIIATLMSVAMFVQVRGLRGDVEALQGQIAEQQPAPVPSGAPPDLCRLLGALAGAERIDQSRVFAGESLGDCEQQAAEAARATGTSETRSGRVTVVNDLPRVVRATYCAPDRGCDVQLARKIYPDARTTFDVQQTARERYVRIQVRQGADSACLLIGLATDADESIAFAAASDAQPDLC